MLIRNTLVKDPTHSEKESLGQIYALLRPATRRTRRPPSRRWNGCSSRPSATTRARGRYKINQRLGQNMPADDTVLTKEDFVEIIRSRRAA